MSTGVLVDLLEILRQPSGLDVLCQRIPMPVTALKGLLTQLEARGLVTGADPGVGACRSGCGSCSMESFCPSSQTAEQEPSALLRKPQVWRLTPLGEAQLESR
jgi:hypothetical protein